MPHEATSTWTCGSTASRFEGWGAPRDRRLPGVHTQGASSPERVTPPRDNVGTDGEDPVPGVGSVNRSADVRDGVLRRLGSQAPYEHAPSIACLTADAVRLERDQRARGRLGHLPFADPYQHEKVLVGEVDGPNEWSSVRPRHRQPAHSFLLGRKCQEPKALGKREDLRPEVIDPHRPQGATARRRRPSDL